MARFVCLALLTVPVLASDSDVAAKATNASSRWPRWLKAGGEYRSRFQPSRGLDFQPGANENCWMTRLRLDLGIEARSWLRFQVQAQDAHAPGWRGDIDAAADALDFRQAFVEVGRAEGYGWRFRLGRQELSFGDERLVGADSYWDPIGRAFDAARLTWSRPGMRVEGFTALAVNSRYRRPNRASTDRRLFGATVTFQPDPGGVAVAPFLLWKSDSHLADGGHLDVYTYGLRSVGPLAGGADYNVEMAAQRGSRQSRPIAAWAGHWEIGYSLPRGAGDDRVTFEYNFGSGDSDPADSRYGAFDDLYPGTYPYFGVADPFRWINIRTLVGTVGCGLSARWRLKLGYRALWLATVRDGLYVDPETWLAHNPSASSSHIGNQLFAQALFQVSPRSQLWLGVARLIPGAYLVEASFNGALTTPYVTWSYRF
ncbi:MAG: alginate export family protein [Bryobacteraceae bacterium]|nr:alginate export family protein [Bryobacteraceae bacterium]